MAEATDTEYTEPDFVDDSFDPSEGRPDLAAFAWREMEAVRPSVELYRAHYDDVQDGDIIEELAQHEIDIEAGLYGTNLIPLVIDDKIAAQTIQEMSCLNGETADQIRARQLWVQTKMPMKLRKLFRGKAIDGDGSLRIWKTPAGRVTVTYYDALKARTFYHQDDSGEVAFSAIKWSVSDREHHVWLDFPGDEDSGALGRVEKFVAFTNPSDASSWERDLVDGNQYSVLVTTDGLNKVVDTIEVEDLDESGQPIPVWPLPSWTSRHVVVHFANNDLPWSDYGKSDVAALIRPQNKLNFLDFQLITAHRFALFPAFAIMDKLNKGGTATADDLGQLADFANANWDEEKHGPKPAEVLNLSPGLLIRVAGDALQKAQTEEPSGYHMSYEDGVQQFSLAGHQVIANLTGAGAPSGEAILTAARYNIAWHEQNNAQDGVPSGLAMSLTYEADTGKVLDFLPEWKPDVSADAPTLVERVEKLGYTKDWAQRALGTTSEERELLKKAKADEGVAAVKTQQEMGFEPTADPTDIPSPDEDPTTSDDSESPVQ